MFYCKEDKDGRGIRAAEWLFTHLAAHLGIPTPECVVLEDGQTGETFFGSHALTSVASHFELTAFLGKSQQNELGQPSEWPGAFLSGLYAYDLFVGNPDRSLNNFMLRPEGLSRRLCAFDFAAANVSNLSGTKFPIASEATVRIGRFLRERHGFFIRAVNEMIDRIAAVPSETITGFVGAMPADWLETEQREVVCALWSKNKIRGRLAALRAGIADESLL